MRTSGPVPIRRIHHRRSARFWPSVIRGCFSSVPGSGFEVMRMKHMALRLAVPTLLSLAVVHGAVATDDVTIGVKGRVNAAPSIAAIGRIVVVAFGASARGVTDVYASVSRDNGRTFGVPMRVNDVA